MYNNMQLIKKIALIYELFQRNVEFKIIKVSKKNILISSMCKNRYPYVFEMEIFFI